MEKNIRVSILNCLLLWSLLLGCQSQSVESDNDSSVADTTQTQKININFPFSGVSPELHAEAVKEGEQAKEEVKKLKQDGSLSKTAKRILAEAEEAEEQGNNELYLAKIQKYSRLLNEEPIKRAAEAKILEGKVLFSQLRFKEAQQAVEVAVKLDESNPEYLLTLAEYLNWNGKYIEIEKVALKAISLIKKDDSLDEKLLAEALSLLGLAYLNKGNYDLVIEPLQKALEMSKKLLGDEHPHTQTVQSNLLYLQKNFLTAES